MKSKNKKIISYLVSASLVVFIGASFMIQKSDYNILTTSVLTMLKGIADEYAPEPPDLEITNIALLKKSSPSEHLNYYKYGATVIIHNKGGNLANARVVLRGDDNQKSVVVRNTDEGFSLKAGESYIVHDYELLFDGDYNIGTSEVTVDIIDKVDIDLTNNSYEAMFYEDAPEITGISLKEILDDGTFVLDFDNSNFISDRHIYEIYYGKDVPISGEERFVESSSEELVHQYFRVKNSLDILDSQLDYNEVTELDSHFIEFDYDPFATEEATYVYVKATDPVSGYYAFSNVLAFAKGQSFTRSEFAQIFIDYGEIKTNDSGFSYFTDVSEEDENYEYIQTLYNEGVLDTSRTNYRPLDVMTRGEDLAMIIDYYDVDLKIGKGAPHFEDVSESHPYFSYAETLYLTGGASAFSEYMSLDKPATKSYLRYLINE
ncbi:hypothetical protein HON58_03530, partial [Candidatus Peregrinibacteria bacterium]|nr:hypothetical protein [Candidatus Peregrinibacteria bacterium]